MKATYDFGEIIDFIENATTSRDVQLIFDVYHTEYCLYSAFHRVLIDAALSIAFYTLQRAENLIPPNHE